MSVKKVIVTISCSPGNYLEHILSLQNNFTLHWIRVKQVTNLKTPKAYSRAFLWSAVYDRTVPIVKFYCS